MTLQYVYLAGPIAGCSFEAATDWREYAAGQFLPGIIGISPMRLKDWCKRYAEIPREYAESLEQREFLISGAPDAIGERDFMDVSKVDMVLAVLPKTSVGTLIEVGWATARKTPVVVVSEDLAIIEHPLVQAHVGWIVPDLDIAIEIVNGALGAYLPPIAGWSVNPDTLVTITPEAEEALAQMRGSEPKP